MTQGRFDDCSSKAKNIEWMAKPQKPCDRKKQKLEAIAYSGSAYCMPSALLGRKQELLCRPIFKIFHLVVIPADLEAENR